MSTIPGQIIEGLLWAFLMLLWGRLIFDWVQMFARRWRPSGLLVVLVELIYSVTDPPIKALRRLIPPLRFGNVSIDLAFLLVLLATYILRIVNSRILL